MNATINCLVMAIAVVELFGLILSAAYIARMHRDIERMFEFADEDTKLRFLGIEP